MNYIYKNMYVGSWRDCSNLKRNETDEDWVIITVADDAQEIGDQHFPITDGGGGEADQRNLELAIQATLSIIEETDQPVLVHCQSGVNRSVSVCMGVLMIHGMTCLEAYEFIRKKRTGIWPNFTHVERACNWANTDPPKPDWKKSGAILDGAEKIVDELYRKVLKRKADPDGLNLYSERLANGLTTPTRLEQSLRNSQEYKKKFG